jgi:hypothetical protein
MSLDVAYESGGYRIAVSPPHGAHWSSTRLMTATEVLERLSAQGCHSTDITDALSAANPDWGRVHNEDVRRRRDAEL